jgi:lipopolysaccharide/colanic/teichoic acid biosynthesis glycosyltransferase
MEMMTINQPTLFARQLRYQSTKHVFDIMLCLLILPLALPIMAICALAIWLDSPGPVFFVQERIGKGGRPFRMYKFRTMQADFDSSGSRAFMQAFVKGELGDEDAHNEVFKPVRNSPITRMGRVLRKTSLDEIPQLINVVKGEMSFVGPRPNVPWEVEVYRPWHHERLEILPGITGLAQVQGRSRIKFDEIVNYDVEYLLNQGLALDLKVLWWTAWTVISRNGVH